LGLLDVPTSGRYFLGGEPTESLADDERAKLRNRFMGFVFQSFHLIPRATALRNVMMPLVYSSSYGTVIAESEQRARAEEALRVVNLSDRMSHRPNELSGGQRQRVAIARALVNNPRVLFADEPTGNLDSKSGKEILALFERLNSQGVTVIMVTHDPAIAQRARRRLVLGDGKLLEDFHEA
jgi:putative ABC transport system ATP-binding protein